MQPFALLYIKLGGAPTAPKTVTVTQKKKKKLFPRNIGIFLIGTSIRVHSNTFQKRLMPRRLKRCIRHRVTVFRSVLPEWFFFFLNTTYSVIHL